MTIGDLHKILGMLKRQVGATTQVFLEVQPDSSGDEGTGPFLVEPILGLHLVRLSGRGAPAYVKRRPSPKHAVQRALIFKDPA